MSRRLRARPGVLAGTLLAGTFAAGVIAGMAVDRWLTPPPAVAAGARDLSDLLDAIQLTSVQRAAATELLERNAPRSEAILREAAEQLRFVADSVDRELRSLLTPDQRARLDSLWREPLFVIKRKAAGGRATVDTLRQVRPDSGR